MKTMRHVGGTGTYCGVGIWSSSCEYGVQTCDGGAGGTAVEIHTQPQPPDPKTPPPPYRPREWGEGGERGFVLERREGYRVPKPGPSVQGCLGGAKGTSAPHVGGGGVIPMRCIWQAHGHLPQGQVLWPHSWVDHVYCLARRWRALSQSVCFAMEGSHRREGGPGGGVRKGWRGPLWYTGRWTQCQRFGPEN